MTLLPKLFLPILLTLSLSACGLFRGSKDETPPADVTATESSGDLGLAEGDDFDFSDDDFSFSEGEDPFAGTEQPTAEGAGTTDDMFGDADFFSDDTAFPESPLTETPSDTAASDPFAADPFATEGTETATDPFSTDAAADPFATDSTTDPFATEDTSASSDLFGAGTSYDSFGTETETDAKSYVPVKKMADAAFDRGGAKLNRIYIVREGDTLASISEKIFGQDRSSDLVTWNPYFSSHDPKVGDKVYYPSPTNPDDNTMMTYYDDKGIPAQTYVASAGENIRTVSKNLLGHDRSWMELYATNPAIESKGELVEGATLRYWPAGVSSPAQAAAPVEDDPFGAPPPTPTDIAGTSPSDDPFGSIEPPSPSGDLGGLNPPPSFGNDDPFGDSDSAMAPPPPPPPPPRQVQPGEELSLPPPPPPPPRAAQKPATAGGEQDNMMLILGGAGLAVLVLIFLLARRKKSSIDMGHTQV